MDLAIDITQWLLFLSIIAAFLISSVFRRNKELRPIQLYIILLLAVNSVVMIFFLMDNKNENYKNLSSLIINLFSIFEILVLYYFLYFKLKNAWFRFFTLLFLPIYISLCFALWIMNKKAIFSFLPDLFGIESLLIVIPCLFHIYEILKTEFNINLKSNPNFIVTCGILFFFSVSVPIYFSWYNLYYLAPGFDKTLNISIIFLSSILNISFMKAYLCNNPKLKQ